MCPSKRYRQVNFQGHIIIAALAADDSEVNNYQQQQLKRSDRQPANRSSSALVAPRTIRAPNNIK